MSDYRPPHVSLIDYGSRTTMGASGRNGKHGPFPPRFDSSAPPRPAWRAEVARRVAAWRAQRWPEPRAPGDRSRREASPGWSPLVVSGGPSLRPASLVGLSIAGIGAGLTWGAVAFCLALWRSGEPRWLFSTAVALLAGGLAMGFTAIVAVAAGERR
jgi:hypothetical protein